MANGKKTGEYGKPFYTYVEEKNFERKLGRPLNDDISARPTTWGELLERRAFHLLGIDYKECSQETIVHDRYGFWAGSPDGQKFDSAGDTVVDTKCPKTLKSFCQLVECLGVSPKGIDVMTAIRETHDDGDKFYYQLVSNAILTKSKYAELVIYMPYLSELEAIRELARNYDGSDQWRYKWIDNATDSELPYLNDNGDYKNLNVVRFEVSQADIDQLTHRVLEAGKLLIKK